MYDGLRVLAVVPARGGSKGVPGKNVRLLAGQPLIVHTLRTAATVDEIDLLVVSTDDAAIAAAATSCGVEVIQRPDELATDTSPTEDALLHALDVLDSRGSAFDLVVVLEPTSPLRSAATIRGAIAACSGQVESVLAVRATRENVGTIENGAFRPLRPGAPRRRQEREPWYIESSTIYACRAEYLRRTGSLVADPWGAVIVPDAEALDINDHEDFTRIEAVLAARRRDSGE